MGDGRKITDYSDFDSYLSFKTFFDGIPKPQRSCNSSRPLSDMNEFLLRMIKLRRNPGFEGIGFRFGYVNLQLQE